MKQYDVIIIGKGPAGISAALYCARAGLRTLVLGKDFGALERAEQISNYYGLERPLSGAELAERGVRQAQSAGADVRSEEVVSVEWLDGFTVRTAQGGEYAAPAALLAAGKVRKAPDIPGLEAFRGKGVSFCAVCDGFLYRGKPVAVLGSGEYAAEEASVLLRFTDRVTVFPNGPLTAKMPEDCAVAEGRVTGIEGGARVERITAESGSHDVSAVFVAVGIAGAADFAQKLGVLTGENGSIVTDAALRTNVPGLFAAGDCTGGYAQVAVAAAQGALAAKGIIPFVRKESAKA